MGGGADRKASAPGTRCLSRLTRSICQVLTPVFAVILERSEGRTPGMQTKMGVEFPCGVVSSNRDARARAGS
jgi:hypothetical protein